MEGEMKFGVITQPLISSWKESLAIVGHAVCVHPQCRLCFLSLAGMVNHHKNCCGWSSPADFIPCTHCGARFKQFRSIQTHNEKCHNNLFSNTSTSQSSAETRSWASPPPPPLPLTPDIVPRHGAPASGAGTQDTAPVAVPGPSHHHPGDSDGDTAGSEMNIEWSRRQSTTSQPSSTYSVREEVLAEKEVQLSELENFVRQAEAKAEQARKEKELSEWERNLQQREFEAKRRLEEATKILHESRFSDCGSISSPRSVISPEPNRALTLASPDQTAASSQHSASPVLQSTPVTSRVTPRPPIQMFGPPRPPIVLPSSTKLPPSAIKLSSSTLALLNAPGPCRRPLSLDETPMNLSRPRTSTTSNTSEDSCGKPTNLSTTSSSDVPALSDPVPVEVRPSLDLAPSDVVPIVTSSSQDNASLPCVNISKDKVFELSVKVVDEGHPSIQAGDAVHISYPLADESTSTYILDDNINLDNILQSSGSSDVTFVAEEGPNGQITLVPTNNGVEQMETDFDNIRRNMQAINVAGDLDTGENNVNSENQEGCDTVDYFENRVKDFEFEINKEEFIQQVEENNLEGGGDSNQIPAPPTVEKESEPEPCHGKRRAETTAASSSKKRRMTPENQKEPLLTKEENVPGRRSSRFHSDVSEEVENSVSENVQKLKNQAKEVFNCGRCKSVLQSERSWKRHRDTVHGGSARLQGDPLGQLFNSEQEERAWNQALASFKKINCPRCNKKTFVKPALLEQHLKTCCNVIKIVNGKKKRDASPIPEKSVDTVNNVDSPGRSRRQAATKARSTVAAFVKAMKTRFDEESSDGDPELPEVMEDSDDNFNVQNEVDLNKFIKRTGLGKKTTFVCQICSLSFKKKAQTESHLSSEHKDKLNDDMDEDDYVDDESVESSMEATDDETDDVDSEFGSTSGRKQKKSEFSSSIQRRLILEPCPDLVELEKLYRNKYYRSDTLIDIEVNLAEWKETNPDEFTPCGEKSIRFSVNESSGGKTLDRFVGEYQENCHMMFCGGPVTSMDWCPSDPTVLALVTKLSDAPSSLSETGPGPGLLQFWRLSADTAPVFLFGLCHTFGNVWALEWCPSGGQGLGLVATSCSDGSVRIWSVPECDQISKTGGLYLAPPGLSLLCPGEEPGQCLSLSWYRGPGHQYLASSHTSGLVSLWHLTSTSTLLRQGASLGPVQTWLAHHGSVTGVSLCPGAEEEPRYLVTGGTDRNYKFWDLRDTSVPIQEVKRGMVSDVKWISGWSGAGVSFDDVYLQSHTQSLLAETGYHSTKSHPVVSQNSSVTGMALSHWLGSMAVCTAAGEMILFVMPSMDRSLEHDKNLGQRRAYVFRTELVWGEQVEAEQSRDYSATVRNARLVYHDNALHQNKKAVCSSDEVRRVRVAELMDTEDLTMFPICSLTSLAWNNSPGHQTLLASGGQAGLVRVHDLRALRTAEIEKVLPSE